MARILSIGPNPESLTARNRALTSAGHEVRGADTRQKAIALAQAQRFDIAVLCNEFLPAYAGQLLDELRPALGAIPVITLSGGQETTIDEIDDAFRQARRRRAA